MKILVFSDIHGDIKAMEKMRTIVATERPDKIVICGDLFGWGIADKMYIADIIANLPSTVYILKGNNDSDDDQQIIGKPLQNSAIMHHFGRNLFFSHGHVYNSMRIPPVLQQGDVLVYGHRHIGALSTYNGLTVVNVPCLSRPRGGSSKGYVIMDEQGITLKELDGNTLDSVAYL